jgi:hypothetical protein
MHKSLMYARVIRSWEKTLSGTVHKIEPLDASNEQDLVSCAHRDATAIDEA